MSGVACSNLHIHGFMHIHTDSLKLMFVMVWSVFKETSSDFFRLYTHYCLFLISLF